VGAGAAVARSSGLLHYFRAPPPPITHSHTPRFIANRVTSPPRGSEPRAPPAPLASFSACKSRRFAGPCALAPRR
jgi:hypothetical protein